MPGVPIQTWECSVCHKVFSAARTSRRMKCSWCHRLGSVLARDGARDGDSEKVALSNYLRMPATDANIGDRYLLVRPVDNAGKATVDRMLTAAQELAAITAELAAEDNPGPDPVAAATVPEFVDAMQQLIVWAGDPPLRDLANKAGVGRLPKSTLHDALNRRDKLPKLALVMELVTACGAAAALPAWTETWKRLRTEVVQARRGRRSLVA